MEASNSLIDKMLKDISDEDLLAITEMLGIRTPTDEKKEKEKIEENTQLAFGLGDGVMTTQAHQRYE